MPKTTSRKERKPAAGAQTTASEGSGRVLLQRSDWVRMGLAELAKSGPSAVNIVFLSERLGVTKGSFYWHFSSKDELLDAILDEWRSRATERVIENLDKDETDAKTKIYQLAVLGVSSSIEEMGGSIELAMRTWAKSNKRVRTAVAAVDRQRLEYLIRQYAEVLPDADPRLMACIHYAFSTGLRQLLCFTEAERIQLREAALKDVIFAQNAR